MSCRSKSPWLRVCLECSREGSIGCRGFGMDVGGSVGKEKREGGGQEVGHLGTGHQGKVVCFGF